MYKQTDMLHLNCNSQFFLILLFYLRGFSIVDTFWKSKNHLSIFNINWKSIWSKKAGNGKIVFSSKIVFLSTGKIVFSKWEALADCLLCKWSTGWLSSLKTVIFTINWALYNCLLSTGELSSLKMRQWTIVFSKK